MCTEATLTGMHDDDNDDDHDDGNHDEGLWCGYPGAYFREDVDGVVISAFFFFK